MIKRSIPEQALKVEARSRNGKFTSNSLKVLFNSPIVSRRSYLPLKDRPDFMDDLEDTVTQQLKASCLPRSGPDTDQMEVTVTIGQCRRRKAGRCMNAMPL